MTAHIRFTSGRLSRRLVLSAAFGVFAAGAFSLAAMSPASAQTPQLVTNPDGSVSYVTAANGAALIPNGGGASYVNATGNPTLITNPDGSVSYANVNGGPSLVVGPNGAISYQNVIAGSNGYQSTLGYSTSNIDTMPSAGNSSTVSTNARTRLGTQAVPAAVVTSAEVSGQYCTLPDGGGQIWVPFGAPSGLASC
jgi:hypothetical protein